MMAVAVLAAALATVQDAGPSGPASCRWEAEVTPASTADGHRLRVLFVDTDGQVALRLGEELVLDRLLQTVQDGTGYSGAVQCRLSGQQTLTISAFGQETMIGLHMDEPNLVVVHAAPGRVRVDLAQTDQPPLLD